MIGRPAETEAAPRFFAYIDRVPGDDPVFVSQAQLEQSLALFATISEDASQRRYAPDKWNIRQVLNHVTDTERAFAFRLLWFARGFETPLASFDPDLAAAGAQAGQISWADHVEEFRLVRLSTLSLLRNMPPAAWTRSGVAGNHHVSVRALAYIIPGHAAHHLAILRERYL